MKSYKKEIKTVDQYIGLFPKDVANKLSVIRGIIHKLAPHAVEAISYNMPAFKLNGILIYFAGYEHHIGLYPMASTIKAFKEELAEYKTSKGTIQIPLDKPLPLPLIRRIVKYRIEESLKDKDTYGVKKVCSRGHQFLKGKETPVCPKCWPGYYKSKK